MTASAPHPLNSINQMRLPQMGSPITSMANDLAHSVNGTMTPKRMKADARFQKVNGVGNAALYAYCSRYSLVRPLFELDFREADHILN